MIPRDFNRAQRDLQARKLPVYREPDTVWSIITSSPGAIAGALFLAAVIVAVAMIALAMTP